MQLLVSMLGDIRLLLIFCGLLTGATLATVTGFGMSVGSLVFLSVISQPWECS